jgi:hypothetical protein
MEERRVRHLPKTAVAVACAAATLLAGGSSPAVGAALPGFTWTLRSPTQSSRFPDTIRRGSVSDYGMAYDQARGDTVMFGGFQGGSALGPNDLTWTWNGVAWLLQRPAHHPSPRFGLAMAYDSARSQAVLFGGTDCFVTNPCSVFNETWTWNGTDWTQRHPATSPPALFDASMAFDSHRGVAVLFGGTPGNLTLSGQTWEWNGTNWAQRAPSTSPPARMQAAMAYDAARRQTVLFGGGSVAGFSSGKAPLGDTWTWDGTAWHQSTAAGPSPREAMGMAFDPAKKATLMFGGCSGSACTTNLSDTWSWSGTAWHELAAGPQAPPSRHGHQMVYETGRDDLLVFGGAGFEDTWAGNYTWRTLLCGGGCLP